MEKRKKNYPYYVVKQLVIGEFRLQNRIDSAWNQLVLTIAPNGKASFQRRRTKKKIQTYRRSIIFSAKCKQMAFTETAISRTECHSDISTFGIVWAEFNCSTVMTTLFGFLNNNKNSSKIRKFIDKTANLIESFA